MTTKELSDIQDLKYALDSALTAAMSDGPGYCPYRVCRTSEGHKCRSCILEFFVKTGREQRG